MIYFFAARTRTIEKVNGVKGHSKNKPCFFPGAVVSFINAPAALVLLPIKSRACTNRKAFVTQIADYVSVPFNHAR